MSTAALLLAATVVLIILAVFAYARYRRFLGGVWAGDARFLEETGLGAAQLFLSGASGGSREGYLLMTAPDGAEVTSSAITVADGGYAQALATAARSLFSYGGDAVRGTLNIEPAERAGWPWPATLKYTLSAFDGTITLYDDETVWFFGARDSLASAAAANAATD
jgi:hypothetical protein